MISEVIPYGGVIYWLLLFLGIYLVTLSALEENNANWPTIWTALTALFAFGFTSYEPMAIEIILAVIAYLMVGLIYSTYRWARLVYNIKTFNTNLGTNKVSLACPLIAKAFAPNDANGYVNLPPEPGQFRTRILLYVLYWPCFTVFAFVKKVHIGISTIIWKLLSRLSKSIYDD